jgi:uncharacterized protein (TIGR03437 family)
LRALTLLVTAASILTAANPFQPTIAPNGVVNAASYLTQAFPRYGIARGSMFIVFGSALGPVDLVQASGFPLPATDGLAGTRVLVSIGAYNATCPMVYSSLTQIAAIMPSNAPEGDGTLVVSYQNLASTSVPIRVVRSAFGTFTRNQAGSGPAMVQNFISQIAMPPNTLANSAAPGQTLILWGTGLGPVNGDESAGPLPGALPYLDALYVGGVPASVRYAGRSGCCAAIDQIIFDVPAGVTGCYVPVTAVTGGVVSNVGTISVASGGGACDDALGVRASSIGAALRNGSLRTGQVSIMGTSAGGVDVDATFTTIDVNTFLNSASRAIPPIGSCALAVSRVDLTPARSGTGLNAGDSILVSGPAGNLTAFNVSSGGYSMSKSPATLSQGSYSVTSTGGSDVGSFAANVNVAAPAVWSNQSTFSPASIPSGAPLTFTWSNADPGGYLTLRVSSANAIYNSEIQCSVAPAANSFTIPAYLMSGIYAGPITVSLTSNSAPVAFSAQGLDVGSVSASNTRSVQTILQAPVVQ